jgi:hypothetical protein
MYSVSHWDRRFQYCVMVEASCTVGDIYRVPQTSNYSSNLLVLICFVLKSEWIFRNIFMKLYRGTEKFRGTLPGVEVSLMRSTNRWAVRK